MASFASSATPGGARKHAWTKINVSRGKKKHDKCEAFFAGFWSAIFLNRAPMYLEHTQKKKEQLAFDMDGAYCAPALVYSFITIINWKMGVFKKQTKNKFPNFILSFLY